MRLLDDGLEVTWTTAKIIRASASSFEVELTDQWGIRRGNLSLGLWDGEIASLLGQEYLATMARRGFSDEEFVDGPPVITGGHSITMVYPRSVIDDNERATHWRANIGGNVKGENWNDWCSDPAPGEDLPEPTLLPGIT